MKAVLWTPVAVLLVGAVASVGIGQQRDMSLRTPLATVLPQSIGGMAGTDLRVEEDVAQVAGFDDYALRSYEFEGWTPPVDAASDTGSVPWASIYVGYYGSQTQGHTIHSPKNCLPGSGWEALSSQVATIPVDGEDITVNRYMLQNGDQRALVLYWYQGRGRVAHNEYLVKWDLLRDAALKRRTDEALVRIVVPVAGSEEAAFDFARSVAQSLKSSVDEALPL